MPADKYSIQEILPGIHEDRIQKLEEGFQEINRGLGENNIKIEHLGEKLGESIEWLGNKMDKTSEAIDKLTAGLQSDNVRIEKLEITESERLNRKKYLLKVMAPVLTAGIGWLLHVVWGLAFKPHP